MLKTRFFISVIVSFLFIALSVAALELNLNCNPTSVASAGTIACVMELSEEVASISSFTFTVDLPSGFSLASVTNVPEGFKDTPSGNTHIIDLLDAASTGLQPQVLGTLNLLAGEEQGTGEVTLSGVELLDDDLNSNNPTPNPSAMLTNTGSDEEGAALPGLSIGVAKQCTGNDPTNAALCADDNLGLHKDTAKTLVAVCTEEVKCEYTCSEGFMLQAGACVPELDDDGDAAGDGDAGGAGGGDAGAAGGGDEGEEEGDGVAAGDGDVGGVDDDGVAGDGDGADGGAVDVSTYDINNDNCLNSNDVWNVGSLLDAFVTKLRELLSGDDGLKDVNTHLWGMYKAWNTGAGCP